MAQEIEDNYEHFDYIIDFVPTAYVLPRRRRVARCAVSMQPPPQVQSTSGSNLSCTIELCVLRVYTEYTRTRRRRITVGTAVRANRRGRRWRGPRGVRKLDRLTVESIRSCTRRMRIQPHHNPDSYVYKAIDNVRESRPLLSCSPMHARGLLSTRSTTINIG